MALVVVSPHMDDAVLSCGELLAASPGAHVLTVFSSGPPSVKRLPDWDEKSGSFRPGDDVMGARRVEDEAALRSIGATAHHLDFWDQQYRLGTRVYRPQRVHMALRGAKLRLEAPGLLRRIELALTRALDSLAAARVFVPLGIWHRDHRLTSQGCLTVARDTPAREWYAYVDLPYGLELPDELEAARQRAKSLGFALEPAHLAFGGARLSKRAAVEIYASQLRPLGSRAETAIAGPESYYRLLPLGGRN